MAFGILECKDGESAPGTGGDPFFRLLRILLTTVVILSYQDSNEDHDEETSESAKGQHQRRGIVLV